MRYPCAVDNPCNGSNARGSAPPAVRSAPCRKHNRREVFFSSEQASCSRFSVLFLFALAPGFEQVFFSIEPGFFAGALGELRGDAGLDVGGKRLVPIERGFGGIRDGSELEALGECARNVAAMKTSRVARGRSVER